MRSGSNIQNIAPSLLCRLAPPKLTKHAHPDIKKKKIWQTAACTHIYSPNAPRKKQPAVTSRRNSSRNTKPQTFIKDNFIPQSILHTTSLNISPCPTIDNSLGLSDRLAGRSSGSSPSAVSVHTNGLSCDNSSDVIMASPLCGSVGP